MELEAVLRTVLAALLALGLGISTWFRARARRAETIPRRREGLPLLLGRTLFGLALLLSILTYLVRPGWMAWSQVALPVALRWAGAVLATASAPLLVWTLAALGPNVSETVLTKESHRLVVEGPYRWVRHPLYAAAGLWLLGLALLMANLFFFALVVVALALMWLVIVPREEEELIKRFGDAYRSYRSRTW